MANQSGMVWQRRADRASARCGCSEGVNLSTARPDLAPALLAVRRCTGALLGATSGRSRRNLHAFSGRAQGVMRERAVALSG
jgi:hypothetical protein